MWTLLEDGTVHMQLDARVYSRDVVLKAVHAFSGRMTCKVETTPDDGWVLLARGLPGQPKPEGLMPQLLCALVDYQLRAKLDTETRPLRDVILAHALRRVDLEA
jgi:His-Xaa-Ser system protein HxsD